MVEKKKNIRQYPPFWEKSIPVFVVIISLAILGLVVVALSVILGIFPAG